MRRVQCKILFHEKANSVIQNAGQTLLLPVPEDAVMYHEELCAPLPGPAEAFHGRVDRKCNPVHLSGAAGDLEAVQAWVDGSRCGKVQAAVQPALDLGECHAHSSCAQCSRIDR